MQRIMAVYDVDPFYADRFAEYANRSAAVPFTAMAFTSMERLTEYSKRESIELLLVGEEVNMEEVSKIQAAQVVRLGGSGTVLEEPPVVYKYRASDAVLREIMSFYQVRNGKKEAGISSAGGQILGVYSPVGRCGKTAFSLTLGQVLARQFRVIFLSLEEYSGLAALMQETYGKSLSDLIYYFRQEEFGRTRFGSLIYTCGGMDYIPPAAFAEDLTDMDGKELAELLCWIATESGYERILVDVGHFARNMEDILDVCQVIYVPIRDDLTSRAKIEEWKRGLELAGRERLWERVRLLCLPELRKMEGRGNYAEQLLWGELGDFVREMVGGKTSKSAWEGRL